MKALLVLIVMLTSIQVRAADQDNWWLARDLKMWVETYKIDINAVNELSNIDSNNEAEKADRDIALCETIGESHSNVNSLFHAIKALYYNINDIEDRKILDRKSGDVIQYHVAFKKFCLNFFPDQYRNISYLQSLIVPTIDGLTELQPLIDKYLATP